MAITTEEIQAYLEDLSMVYSVHDEGELVVPFQSDRYVNFRGDKSILIVIQLSENGEYIKFFSPMAYQITNEETRLAALQSFAMISWRILMVDFEYDANDGEVRPTIDFPVEDSTLTAKQIQRCLTTIARVIDEFDEPIRHAIESGEIHEALMADDLESAIRSLTSSEEEGSEQDGSDEDIEELRDNLEELRDLLGQLGISEDDEEEDNAAAPEDDEENSNDDDDDEPQPDFDYI